MSTFEDEIDEAAMAEADAALKALSDEYPSYAAADVAAMEAALADLAAGTSAASGLIADIYATAHNIKGQGSAFGYELITELGEALCLLTRDRSTLEPGPLAAVSALVGACRTVLTERLTGDGGVRGAQIRAHLGISLRAA